MRFADISKTRLWLLCLAVCIVLCGFPSTAVSEGNAPPAGVILSGSAVSGGLCVQVGCDDLGLAVELAGTGRFLVQVLDADAAVVQDARGRLQAQGRYGPVTVKPLNDNDRLPYAENLVNLLVIEDGGVPLAEIVRVLCPRGVAFLAAAGTSQSDLEQAGLQDIRAVDAAGSWISGRKAWPAEMDTWGHPRHAADGNAVSHDQLVGPARRVRWVTGPSQEISNMVTSAGRNYYGGLLARDGFNGLRLWKRTLDPSPARGGYSFASAPGSVRPVAVGGLLLVVSEKKLQSLDGATGEPVRQYLQAGTPTDVLHLDATLITIDARSVRALDAENGRLAWKHQADQPRYIVAGDGHVYFFEGVAQRGQKCAAVCLELATGKLRWRKDDYPWADKVRRCVYHDGLLAYEISTLNNDKPDNGIRVASAANGELLWDHQLVPGMAHYKQARALFVGDRLWVLDEGKCFALDPQTGEITGKHAAGSGHCFPPVATDRFLFAGELNMTELETGHVDANRITKGACGRDVGFVPANGLINIAPKHCICWPMLRGYVGLAAASADKDAAWKVNELDFTLQRGVEPPPAAIDNNAADSWPCYRHDAWRSGSTAAEVPIDLKSLWTVELGRRPDGPIADDWRDNPFVVGPITSPVVAGGRVFVARPDAHQVVALDVGDGAACWRFTADGRIDTAPTIHQGLCLFGTKSGSVYCLRADDGRMVWRLCAAPHQEQIVAYGQIESPWPVPGSVLLVDDVLFFAAGRQSLADGGILVFAVEPATGEVRWVKKLDSVPQKGFYGGLGLEFDNFDLLHREGPRVAMSRWLFDRETGRMTVEAASGFALLRTRGDDGNEGRAMVPRGFWSYAPRNNPVQAKPRPLVAFRGNTLFGCTEDKRTVYRRDFDPDELSQFNTVWSVREAVRKTGDKWRSERLARGARWSVEVFDPETPNNEIAAIVLARDTLFVAGSRGGLTALSADDGKRLARMELPEPVWDGMAAAAGRLFLSTRDGRVVCLAKQ